MSYEKKNYSERISFDYARFLFETLSSQGQTYIDYELLSIQYID